MGRRGLEPKSQTAVKPPPPPKKKELLVVLLIFWFETDEELSVCFGGGWGWRLRENCENTDVWLIERQLN